MLKTSQISIAMSIIFCISGAHAYGRLFPYIGAKSSKILLTFFNISTRIKFCIFVIG